MTVRKSQTYDNATLMHLAAGAVAASGVGQVGGSARVLDVGLADLGRVKAVCDATSVDRTTGDETYGIVVQGSVDQAFTTPVTLGRADIIAAGRSEIYFSNNQAGTLYRYVRVNFVLAGTTPTFVPVVYLAKD